MSYLMLLTFIICAGCDIQQLIHLNECLKTQVMHYILYFSSDCEANMCSSHFKKSI